MNIHAFRPAPVARLKEAVREIHVSAGLDAPRTGPGEPVVIGVTSPNVREGKTTVALALAGSLSTDFGANVMLVDGDLHTPSLGKEFGLDGQDGLWDVVAGTATLDSASHPLPAPGLRVLAAGNASGNPARLARSEQFLGLLNEIKRSNQYVVIDLPATLHTMTAPTLAKRCTGVVVVVNAFKTTSSDLERTMHLLAGANILGVVINRSSTSVPKWMARMLNIKG
jgi:succinoglycan biosynthesis transport protein ExoP